MDGLGNPVEGAPVAVASGTISLTATTNAQGIYAVKGLASNTTWTLTPANESWAFTPTSLTVTTGHSSANGGVGDKSGLNFASQRETGSVIVQLNTAAMAAGACWRLDSGPWTASGVTVNSIPVGVHTLSYRPATGWVTPAPQPVNIVERQTARVLVAYAPAYSLTAIPDNSANGQVAADPAPGALGSYARNTIVTLTASPAAGYYFGGWIESGTLINTNATYTSVVKGARALVANFVPDSLTGENSQVYVTSNKTSDIIDALADIGDTAGAPFVISVTQPANGKVTINANGT